MDILLWNVQSLRSRYNDWLIAPSLHARILCFQETHLYDHIQFTIPRYTCYRADRQDGLGGGVLTAIHSSLSSRRLPASNIYPFEYTVVILPVNDWELGILNVYHSTDSLMAAHLQDFLPLLPPRFFILGDFNGHHPSWGASTTNRTGSEIFQFIQANNLCVLNTSQPTYSSRGSSSNLDLMICSANIYDICTWTICANLHGSDHFPVLLQLGSRAVKSSVTRRIIHWPQYRALLANTPPHSDDSSTYISTIQEAMKNASYTVTGSAASQTPWFTTCCRRALRDKRQAWYRHRREPTTPNWIDYKKKRAIFRRIHRQEKRNYYFNTLEQAASTRTVYRAFCRLIKYSTDCTNAVSSHYVLLQNGQLLTSLDAQISAFTKNLETTSISDVLYSAPNHRVSFSALLDPPFTWEEFQSALRSTPSTSPGCDGVTIKHLRQAPVQWQASILRHFNHIWNSGTVPTAWLRADITLIKKPGRDAQLPSSYRPIALLPVTTKVLERLIQRRLNHLSLLYNVFPTFQFGFRPFTSTTHLLVQLKHHIQLAQVRKHYCILAYLDLQSAYDSIWIDGLLHKLSSIGFSGKFLHFLHNYLQHRTLRISWRGRYGQYIPSKRGVPQGSVLSPWLFNIYLSDIPIPTSSSLQLFTYADDIFILGSSSNKTYLIRTFQQYLDHISTWAANWHLHFCPTKSELCNFSLRQDLITVNIRLHDVPLQMQDHVKVLGITLDRRLTWRLHILDVSKRITKVLNIIRGVSNTFRGAPGRQLLITYLSIFLGTVTYGAPVWYPAADSLFRHLRTIYHEVLRRSLGLPRATPVEVLYAMSGKGSLEHILQIHLIKFYLRQLHSPLQTPLTELSRNFSSLLYYRRNFRNPPYPLHITELLTSWNIPSDVIRTPPCMLYTSRDWPHNITFHVDGLPFQNILTGHMSIFQSYADEHWPGHCFIATDASKTSTVGASIITSTGASPSIIQLPSHTSIFTAESVALWKALTDNITDQRNYALLTDSKSALIALHSWNWRSPTIIGLLGNALLKAAEKAKTIKLIWVPGHKDISLNEKADHEAKRAAREGILLSYNFSSDSMSMLPQWTQALGTYNIRLKYVDQIHLLWDACNNLSTYFTSRRFETIFYRLCTNTAPLSQFLYRIKKTASPLCWACHTPESSTHYLFHCRCYSGPRHLIFPEFNATDELSAWTQLWTLSKPLLVQRIEEYISITKRFDN